MQKIFITRKIPQAGIDLLKQDFEVSVHEADRPMTRSELLAAVKDADGVLCLLTDRIDAEVFDTAVHCLGFANYAVGYDNMDVAEATRRKIPLSNTPGVLNNATAEMAWALLFSVSRRIVESDALMRSGNWQGWGPLQFIGGDVEHKTLGIVGAGRIGAAMAMKSRGFNMNVLYADEYRNEKLERELGAERVSFEQLAKRSDFISIHVPLLETTRHLFHRDVFKMMKNTAYLINTARGPIINELHLVEALQRNEIAGAGLDVFEFEPEMAAGLSSLANTVICPHIASATIDSRTNMALTAARNLQAMLQGEQAPQCINPEIY